MNDNVFLEDQEKPSFEEYMEFAKECRGNMGEDIPLAVYRLLEYSIREELIETFGEDVQIDVFRKAGYRSGVYFAKKFLNLGLSLNEFLAALQKRLEEMRIGILRIEALDIHLRKIILTISEDADCSGLPLLGKTVCNYDEGFLEGIFFSYTGKEYQVVEIDCWATGDRVCRFCAKVRK